MANTVQLLIPIMVPFKREVELYDLHKACLADLRQLTELPASDNCFGGACLKIQVLDTPESEPLLQGRWKPSHRSRSYALLKLEVDVTACITSISSESERSEDIDISAQQLEHLHREFAISLVEYELNLLLLIACVAWPGALSAIEGYAFFDNQFLANTDPFFAEDLFEAIQVSNTNGWPRLLSVGLAQSWSWLIESKVIVDGVGTGPLGRALSALSHLTSPNLSTSSSVALFWILLGLEALYGRGSSGLKEQLLGKTEVILGPRTENKKLFGAVYDFRSRLIHGDIDVPLRISKFDAVEKFEKYHAELYRNESIALAALIGTLQWMIQSRRFELVFSYSLSEGVVNM